MRYRGCTVRKYKGVLSMSTEVYILNVFIVTILTYVFLETPYTSENNTLHFIIYHNWWTLHTRNVVTVGILHMSYVNFAIYKTSSPFLRCHFVLISYCLVIPWVRWRFLTRRCLKIKTALIYEGEFECIYFLLSDIQESWSFLLTMATVTPPSLWAPCWMSE